MNKVAPLPPIGQNPPPSLAPSALTGDKQPSDHQEKEHEADKEEESIHKTPQSMESHHAPLPPIGKNAPSSTPSALTGNSQPSDHQEKEKEADKEEEYTHETTVESYSYEMEREIVIEESNAGLASNTNVVAGMVAIEMEEEIEYRRKLEIREGEDGFYEEEVFYIHTKRKAIYTSLYYEARNTVGTWSIEDEGEDAVDATCAEHCTDFCCQSCVCNFKTAFSRHGGRRLESEDIMSSVLRRGRAKGWGMFRSIISPLLTDMERDIWVVAQLLTALVALVLSIAALGLKETRVVNFLFFACTLFCGILAILDGIFTLRSCRSCRQCHEARKRRRKIKPSETVSSAPKGITEEHHHNSNDEKGNNECEKDDQTSLLAIPKTEGKDDLASPDSPKTSTLADESHNDEHKKENKEFVGEKGAEEKKEHSCASGCRAASDVIRIILSELMLYILMVLGMLEAITGQGKTSGNVINIVVLAITCISLLLYVYVARIMVVIRMIRNVHRVRKPDADKRGKAGSKSRYDSTISNSGLSYLVYFLVHVIMQMLVQVLILVAIGGKIEFDNQHFFENDEVTDRLHVSGHLWYMIVSGYVLSILGIFTFFIATFYWAQEFPVGLCLDLVSILEMECNENDCSFDSPKDFVQTIDRFVRIDKLVDEFDELRSTNCCKKFLYPFKTPVLVIVCLIYALLAMAFVISAGVTSNGGSLMPQVLNGGGWAIYFIIAIILAVLANIYTMLVAGFWLAVIAAIIIIIALTILACVCKIMSVIHDD